MDYYTIRESIKQFSRTTDDPAIDSIIERSINRHYRTMAKGRLYPQLMMKDGEFETTDGDYSYVMPFPLLEVEDESIKYDVDSDGNGKPIKLLHDVKILNRTNVMFAQGSEPAACMLNGRLGTTYYSTGSVTVVNKSASVTGVTTAFTSAMVGKWITIGYSSSSSDSGAGYPYKISAVGSGTALTLSEPYRGPNLTQAAYAIEPAGSLMLEFAPRFTEYGKTVNFSWYRSPRRLYNPEDEIECDNLCDALIAAVCADLDYYANDGKGMERMQRQSQIFGGKTRTASPIAPR